MYGRPKRQYPIPLFPTSVISYNFFMWTKVITPVEETKKTISDIQVIGSASPWNTAVPPTTRHTAYNHLRRSTSHFMKIVIEVAVPPTTRRSAYNSGTRKVTQAQEYQDQSRAADRHNVVRLYCILASQTSHFMKIGKMWPCRHQHDVRLE